MPSGIYKITNQINQKCYIGSAVDLERRKKQHFRGRQTNKILKQAMKKYGKAAFRFDILVLCEPENLTFVEQDQIDYWKKVKGWENMYNICEIAGSTLGVKYSEESKKLMSDVMRGRKNPSLAERNRQANRAGDKNPMYGRTGDKNPRYDSTIYLFQHKSGKTFQGTAYELRTKEGLDQSSLSKVINKKLRSTGGWSIVLPPEDA
jgi:group I intron endonuclease